METFMKEKYYIKVILLTLTRTVLCSIDGINYMDPIPPRILPGEDPCKPLYWYPREVPEFCNHKMTPKPIIPLPPLPFPMPVPQPMPVPFFPQPPPPIVPVPPIPYGIPIAPMNPMLPISGAVYPHLFPPPQRPGLMMPVGYPPGPGLGLMPQAGMVPGINGLVSPDGGINILPFSDPYADLLERHKNMMVRIKLEKLLKKYDHPNMRRRFRRKFIDDVINEDDD